MSGGRHELVQRLAQGYLGGLWVARRGASTPGPALALVRRITFTNRIPEEAEQRLAESAWDAMGIRHDNVLRVSEVVHAERTLDVVYDHVDAQPLQSLMLRANIRRHLFPMPVTLRVVADLLLGVEAMQRTASELGAGVGAGGLSPESVLVTREGQTLLCDALVASTAATIEEFGRNPAKLGYAAPEQLTQRSPPPATDVFACAVLLWELIAARRFLLGPRPALERRLREHQLPDLRQALKGDREVHPALIDLIERALGFDPKTRPADPAELRLELLSCGQEVCETRDVARYFADLTGAASERRPGDAPAPRSDTSPDSAPAAPSEEVPSSENTPVARVSVAPTLDKVAAWLDGDEPTGHWTSRSSSFRPPHAAREDAGEAAPESAPQPSAPPMTPPASRVAREKEKAEPSAAKPVALQQTVPRASSQPSLIPKGPPRAPTPNPAKVSPAKVAAAKATTQPLRLSRAAPKPSSQAPVSSKVTPKPSSQPPLSRKLTPKPSSALAKPKAITQPALPKAKAASLAPPAPAASSPPATPAVAVLTRPVLAIGEPLANPPPPEPLHAAEPEAVVSRPPSIPTLIGAPSLQPTPPLPELSPPPPQVTPTAPLVIEPSVVRSVVREIRAPRPTKTPTVPVSPLARSRSAPPPPIPPQPVALAGFASVPAAVQSARDSNIPGAPPNPVPERAAMVAPPPPLPQIDHKLAASSRNKLLLVAAVVLGVFMLILVLLKPADPPWAALTGKSDDGPAAPGAPGDEQKTNVIVPPAPAAPVVPAADADAGNEATAAPPIAAAADASAKLAEASAEAATPPADAPAPVAAGVLDGPLPLGTIDDELLLAAFGAEAASDVSSCREKTVVVSKAAAKKTPKSQLAIARRALVRGQRTRAHQILCEISARDPKAAPLQRDLTDLALRLGDAEQALFLAERALGRKKNDPVMVGLLGDALAETHNIPDARGAWLGLLNKGKEARRAERLASSFSSLGQRSLKKKAYADAQRFYRRALILSQGDAAAGLGYGEALLRQGDSRGALAWLERAGRTYPKDAQAQALLGEALYDTGDADAARKAFKSAVTLRPKDQKLRKRIARATRERGSSNN